MPPTPPPPPPRSLRSQGEGNREAAARFQRIKKLMRGDSGAQGEGSLPRVRDQTEFPLLTSARLAFRRPKPAAAEYLFSRARPRTAPAWRTGYNLATSWPERICYLYPILAAAHRTLSPDFTG